MIMVKDDDQAIEMDCPSCGLHGTAWISLWGQLTEVPEGFNATKAPKGHRFTCQHCGLEPVIPGARSGSAKTLQIG
jgi:predicted RNA-binding Zn-ribbon protein involved in translation (DUF1610 family)